MKNKQLRELTLLGYYGRNNTGDDAMLYGLLALLHKSCPSTTLNVPTNKDIVIPLAAVAQVEFFPRKVFPILVKIVNSDAILIGGGTIFHDYSNNLKFFWAILRYFLLILWAKSLGKRVYMVGVGLGPFTTRIGLTLIWLISRLMDYATVRDSESMAFLQGLGIPSDKVGLTFDLACLLAPSSKKADFAPPILGVSALPFFSWFYNEPAKDQILAKKIADGLNQWLEIEPNGMVRLLVFHGRNDGASEDKGDVDLAIAQEIQRQIKDAHRVELIEYSPDPTYLLMMIMECTAVITMRYHAAVFAYIAQRPMILLSYHPKCKVFAKDICFPSNMVLSIDDIMKDKLFSYLQTVFDSLNEDVGTLPLTKAKHLAQLALPPSLRG